MAKYRLVNRETGQVNSTHESVLDAEWAQFHSVTVPELLKIQKLTSFGISPATNGEILKWIDRD